MLHVDVLSLPSQLRVDKRWSYSELLAPSYLDKEKKEGNGKKIYGGENPFHSFISHCTATAPGTSMGTKPSGAHCIRSTQFHIISEIISFFTLIYFFLLMLVLNVRYFENTMRKSLLNWCHLVSISKNVVFYVSLVVRIY